MILHGTSPGFKHGEKGLSLHYFKWLEKNKSSKAYKYFDEDPPADDISPDSFAFTIANIELTLALLTP